MGPFWVPNCAVTWPSQVVVLYAPRHLRGLKSAHRLILCTEPQILRPLLGALNLDLNLFVDLDEHFARWLSTIAVLLLHPTILFYLFRADAELVPNGEPSLI